MTQESNVSHYNDPVVQEINKIKYLETQTVENLKQLKDQLQSANAAVAQKEAEIKSLEEKANQLNIEYENANFSNVMTSKYIGEITNKVKDVKDEANNILEKIKEGTRNKVENDEITYTSEQFFSSFCTEQELQSNKLKKELNTLKAKLRKLREERNANLTSENENELNEKIKSIKDECENTQQEISEYEEEIEELYKEKQEIAEEMKALSEKQQSCIMQKNEINLEIEKLTKIFNENSLKEKNLISTIQDLGVKKNEQSELLEMKNNEVETIKKDIAACKLENEMYKKELNNFLYSAKKYKNESYFKVQKYIDNVNNVSREMEKNAQLVQNMDDLEKELIIEMEKHKRFLSETDKLNLSTKEIIESREKLDAENSLLLEKIEMMNKEKANMLEQIANFKGKTELIQLQYKKEEQTLKEQLKKINNDISERDKELQNKLDELKKEFDDYKALNEKEKSRLLELHNKKVEEIQNDYTDAEAEILRLTNESRDFDAEMERLEMQGNNLAKQTRSKPKPSSYKTSSQGNMSDSSMEGVCVPITKRKSIIRKKTTSSKFWEK